MYEPCSPGLPNSIAVTLQQLADQGKASQVQTALTSFWACIQRSCDCAVLEM